MSKVIMSFGSKITLIRKNKRLSQNELGKLAKVSGDIIGKYERDEMKPSIDTAHRLGNALNVTLDYLVGDSDTIFFDTDITKRMEAILNMDSEDKHVIFRVLDAYIRDTKAKKAYQQNTLIN